MSSLEKKGFKNINGGSPRLDKKLSHTLHYIVSKLLWVEKGGSPDIEPSMSFLCTRVTKSTMEDKAKLKRVLKLLKQTINDKMVMGADKLSQIFTWVNAPYGVQPYLKSHTGGGISFGYGLVR